MATNATHFSRRGPKGLPQTGQCARLDEGRLLLGSPAHALSGTARRSFPSDAPGWHGAWEWGVAAKRVGREQRTAGSGSTRLGPASGQHPHLWVAW
jgi:hypothetical protein